MRLHYKLIILICSLLIVVIVLFELIFQSMLQNNLKHEMGVRALAVAQTISNMPEIKEAFYTANPSQIIQPITEEIRKKTKAEFIVVGNRDEIRYSHPITERIGKKMVGGDNALVFQGKEIVSESIGSLGRSLRGKAPVFDGKGEVIGVVSVGFLTEDIEKKIEHYRQKLLYITVFIILGGIGGALLIAYSVKKAIFGLEPREIAHLYQEKQAILESIHEGIIAINQKGIVTMANAASLKLLGVSNAEGKHLVDILPRSRLLNVVETGHAEFDQESIIGDNVVVVNRIPIYNNQNQISGAVASFRNKSELKRLTEELSHIKKYAEGLRAQTHEYSNKLHTISGLIQLESYQEVIDFITKESDVTQNLMHFIMKKIPDPIVGGLLLGKFSRANELKVELEIEEDSTFADIPSSINRDSLVTIIGNLIDNAMEAVIGNKSGQKKVKVFLTDLGEDLIIEVEDTGKGIDKEYEEHIFEIGFTTKKDSKNSGFGLALVQQAVTQMQGYIIFSENEYGGTTFTVAIPKRCKE
ncbi:sensor histidine kinase [Bacillus sp. 165]|uniref:ATP-binding protein n=1 Tax=Bacillus sp. 165 TaxID=1529117 RepID=UPI001ADB2A08|nr:sensor histidine kinase [Bacillus sp. 165]MBO9128793.1 sensor histidine kinase [Bacillus sp. 165]